MKTSLLEHRKDFPILETQINGYPLTYLDNSATTQLPEPVLYAICQQYHCHQANVHRGIHTLSERSTMRLEASREMIRQFIGAAHGEEIIFTSGATAAINLVAHAYVDGLLQPGDEIIVTQMEHHANLIPWQETCRRCRANLRVLPVDSNGDLELSTLPALLSSRTRLMAVTWISNVSGAVNPIHEIIRQVHQAGAEVLIDASQAIRHGPIRVQELDCDYLCFSGHKMMGPTGTGIFYGKRACLERLRPMFFGGGMVDTVTDYRASFGELPHRLEAGTPNIVGNIALGAAVEYLQAVGLAEIAAYEDQLLASLRDGLAQRQEVQLFGAPKQSAGCVSFQLQGMHCYDVARLLDQQGIAVRSGHHCAQPYLTAMGAEATVRVSPAFYNTAEEIERFFQALDRIIGLLHAKGNVQVRRPRKRQSATN